MGTEGEKSRSLDEHIHNANQRAGPRMQFFLFVLSPHHASWICTRKVIQRE